MSSIANKSHFEKLRDAALGELKAGEHLFIGYSAESSQFLRINSGSAKGARIRQLGLVEDASIELTFVHERAGELRKATQVVAAKEPAVLEALRELRAVTPTLPVDPYAQLPEKKAKSSVQETRGKLLAVDEAPARLCAKLDGLDVAGIYAAGPMVRAMANSAGLTHWFSTETFSFDYSIYVPGERCLKGTYAGTEWNDAAYAAEIERARAQLSALTRAPRKIERGEYRTYLAPAAFHELMTMMNWGCVSEAAIRQGDSPLRHLRTGEHTLSPLFTLGEDFTSGESPRFNAEGDVAPEQLTVIEKGTLKNTLVSARSSKEYGVESNGASGGESLRALSVKPGTLAEKDILRTLGTGLYLSNLHYLNWSDQPGGRITGMTRYACFWVEDGEIVAPIENLRWDDTIFRMLGSELEALTTQAVSMPEIGTYSARSLGATRIPGALLKSIRFTL